MSVVPVSTIPVVPETRVVEPYVNFEMEIPQYGADEPLVRRGK